MVSTKDFQFPRIFLDSKLSKEFPRTEIDSIILITVSFSTTVLLHYFCNYFRNFLSDAVASATATTNITTTTTTATTWKMDINLKKFKVMIFHKTPRKSCNLCFTE